MLICRNCGAQLPDGVPFCSTCGAPQSALAPQYAPTPQGQSAAESARSGYEAWKQQQAAPYAGQGYVPQQTEQPPWGGYATPQAQQPDFDWEHLQPRTRPAGASALIAAVTLLLAAAAMLIWGMTV